MLPYKAIFFDRDQTIIDNDPEMESWRDAIIASWSGRPFTFDYDKMTGLFTLASEGRTRWYHNVEDEKIFFLRYYRHMLEGEGITEDLDIRSKALLYALWPNASVIYPETVEALRYFHGHGYKMGVISNTSPSLELTLQRMGLAQYFTSFTASSLVGAGKPDPLIYNAALQAQGVDARDSLFVDDKDSMADGARKLGMTSFQIDRTNTQNGPWIIHSLLEIVAFVDTNPH